MKRFALLTVLVFAMVASALSVAAQDSAPDGGDLIVVGSADTVRQITPQQSTGLGTLLSAVPARLAIEFANSARQIVPSAPPAQLRDLLTAAPPRLIVEYANSMRTFQTANVPAALKPLLNGVAPRLTFEFANHNREFVASYPKALLNDRTAPKVVAFTTDGTRIHWTTDEFATSVIRIGLGSGSYSQTFTDPLFRTEHELALPREVVDAVAAAEAAGAPDAMEATYFVRIISTDLSDNQSTSKEYRAVGTTYTYLPMIDR